MARYTKGTLSDRVASVLLDQINLGNFDVGERLPSERMLAEVMEVSRVSIRAAIQNLKAQGFLTAVQGGGTRVASRKAANQNTETVAAVEVSSEKFGNLVSMRLQIDRWAVSLAIPQISAQQLGAMASQLAELEDPSRPWPEKLPALNAFRSAWTASVGSPVFDHIDSTIAASLETIIQQKRHAEVDTDALFGAPRAFYEALKSGDLAEALKVIDTNYLKRDGIKAA